MNAEIAHSTEKLEAAKSAKASAEEALSKAQGDLAKASLDGPGAARAADDAWGEDWGDDDGSGGAGKKTSSASGGLLARAALETGALWP